MKVKIGKFYKSHSALRKINVQIESFDTWNLDHTLALVILPALLQLKQEKHGVPSEFADVGGEDYVEQASFDFYSETKDEAFEIGLKRWDVVLDKMIWSFQQLVLEDYTEKYFHGRRDFSFEKSSTSTYINPLTGKTEPAYGLVDKNPGQHWVDYAGLQEHERRIQEGLELFGKHFRSLWD